MTQQHLNHCMVFHIHQNRTGALDLNSIAKEFAQTNERRIVFSDIFFFWTILKFTYMLIMNFIKSINFLFITLISV